MPDPVSWLLIESGWSVVDREGNSVGKVFEVVGDTSVDIFDGLAISTGLLGKPRYVPAERVGDIVEGEVELELTKDEIDRLPEYDGAPPSERILPD